MTNGIEMKLSYEVRIYKTEIYQGKQRTSYRVRWSVAGARFKKVHATKKLAESFVAKLTTAAREGTAFDVASGLPLPMAKDLHRRSWFLHACEYVDLKWPHVSPGHRRGISETLTQATLALLTSQRGKPDDAAIRKALHGWAFSRTARGGVDIADATPPEKIAPVIRWLEANTIDLSELLESAVTRRALNKLALRHDGKAVAGSTIARRRATFHGALQYGVELKFFIVNPLESISWAAPKQDDAVDRRVLANPTQIRSLLGAVREFYPSLEAYYGGMYYAAMRPSEVRHLAKEHLFLPETDGEWGELLLDGSTQQTGQAWSDTGAVREDRPLKHRSERSTRTVPICPEYCALLRRHLDLFGTGPNGQLFVTRTGPFGHVVPLKEYSNPVHPNTSTRTWGKARKRALTDAQYNSPLARRPYDLRHAGVSLWLNAGVPATQVAEWAGHSVKVLLQVYAGCIDGQDEAAKRRIAAALTGEVA